MQNISKIILAGGCFWCTQADMLKLNGVVSVTSIYIGLGKENPTYEEVCSGKYADLKEAVKVVYDNKKITLPALLEYFFLHIDPTTENKQFFDVGFQYQTAVFYASAEEKKIIEDFMLNLESKNILQAPIKTLVLPLITYWPAEEYHQDFASKNPEHYNKFKTGSLRDEKLAVIWQKYNKKL